MASSSSTLFGHKDAVYYVDNTKFLKIWFNSSGDSDNWLPELNRLRLIDFRADNPDITINLLVDKTKLSDGAIEEMNAFAEIHQISIVDLNEYGETLDDDFDKKIYALVRKELDHKDGNPAAARDLVTALPSLLVEYGTYSDHDTKLFPPKAPVTKLERVDALKDSKEIPRVLMPYVREKGGEHRYNNDLLIVPRQKGETDNEVEYALRKVMQSIQQKMIEYYQPKKGLEYNPTLSAAVSSCVVRSSAMSKWDNFEGDAIELRAAILDVFLEKVKSRLKLGEPLSSYLKSSRDEFIQSVVQKLSQDPYFSGLKKDELMARGIASFEGLGKAYHSNQLPFDTLIIPTRTIEKTRINPDLSWLPDGLEEKYIKTELEALREKYPEAGVTMKPGEGY